MNSVLQEITRWENYDFAKKPKVTKHRGDENNSQNIGENVWNSAIRPTVSYFLGKLCQTLGAKCHGVSDLPSSNQLDVLWETATLCNLRCTTL